MPASEGIKVTISQGSTKNSATEASVQILSSERTFFLDLLAVPDQETIKSGLARNDVEIIAEINYSKVVRLVGEPPFFRYKQVVGS